MIQKILVMAALVDLALGVSKLVSAWINITLGEFIQLKGCQEDHDRYALQVFFGTCPNMKLQDFQNPCVLVLNRIDPEVFFKCFLSRLAVRRHTWTFHWVI
jgi:hypothetical protein